MKYENRIVLFLDILGFRYIIDKTVDKDIDKEEYIEGLYNSLEDIGNFCKENLRKEDYYSVRVTQFSDSIIVSFLNYNNETLLKLIRTIQKLIIKLVNEGILCRGAISYGKLIHDSKVIFGPALNEAYETESKAAIYPRVILDKSIIELGKKGTQTKLFKEFIMSEEIILSYLGQDTDEKYYINYFPNDIGKYRYRMNIQNYLKNLRTIIINGSRFTKPDLKVKYGWMKNKYNRLLDTLKSEEKIREISEEKGLLDYVNKVNKLK